MNQLLVIDDDKQIQLALQLVNKNEDFLITSAFNMQEAKEIISNQRFDLIILDIMLPDGNGFDLLYWLRDHEIHTPVLCLSIKDDEAFKLAGLGIGADDYMTKPFSITLLKSKIKALIRRNTIYTKESSICCGPFNYNSKQMIITMNEVPLDLTAKELQILKLFIENPNQVFTKEQIYRQIWNNDIIDDNAITVYIKRIRSKIEKNPTKPEHLLTVWGIGYKFTV